MRRLLTLVIFASLMTGCIGADDPLPLDSPEDIFDAAIESGDAWDLQRILNLEEAYRLEISDTVSGAQSLMMIGEDQAAGLTRVSMLTVVGNETVDFELIEGGSNYHVRIGETWYLGRDAVPESFDPLSGCWGFYGYCDENQNVQTGLPMDVSEFSSLEWRVTWDIEAQQLVAVANNQTSQILLELRGMPPLLVKAESYSNDGQSSTIFSIITGDDARLQVQEDSPIRMPVPVSGEVMMNVVDGIRIWEYTVAEGFRWEVELNEVELHVGERESDGNLSVLVEFPIEAGHLDYTDEEGSAWTFDHFDHDEDGLFSGGDVLRLETDSDRDFDAAIYDLWAESYPESFLPSHFFYSLLIFFFAPLFRKEDSQ
jgi:hypothetical protein